MTTPTLSIDHLREVLGRVAGEDDSVDLTGDISGRSFADLGYDSIAVLELSANLEREFGIKVDDAEAVQSPTVGAFRELINQQIEAKDTVSGERVTA